MMPNVRVQENEAVRASQSAQAFKSVKQSVVMIGLLFLAAAWVHGQNALQIDNKGNVGIGMSAPEYKLDIFGRLRVSGNDDKSNKLFLITNTATTGSAQAGIEMKQGDNVGQIFQQDKNYWLYNVADGQMCFATNKERRMCISSDGKLDIGPGNVLGATEVWARALRVVSSAGSDGKDGGAFGVKGLGKTPNYAYIAIPTKDSLGWDSDKILVLNNYGNVGIGTTDPKSKLDVAGDAKISGTVAMRNLKVAGGDFRVVDNDTTQQGVTAYWNGAGYATINAYKWSDQGGLQPLRVDGSMLLLNTLGGGNVGIKTDNPKTALEVNGDLTAKNIYASEGLMFYWSPDGAWKSLDNRSGPILGGTVAGTNNHAAPSDLRLKIDLRPIASALDKIGSVRGVTYRWDDNALQYFTRDIETTLSAGPHATEQENRNLWQKERDRRYKELRKTQVGVVAQDVEVVLPEAVTTDEAGYKEVAYDELIPLLIEAIKEEDKISKEQAHTIARQQSEIQRLRAANDRAQQQLSELQNLKQRLTAIESVVANVLPGQVAAASENQAVSAPRTSEAQLRGNLATQTH